MTADTFITVLSASGVILVTIASIMYNKHYRDAKEAQITALKQLISPEVFEYFEKSRKILGESIQSLKDDIASKNKEIAQLRTERHVDQDKIQALTVQRSRSEELARQIENIDRQLHLTRTYKYYSIVYKQPPFQQTLSRDEETIFLPPENDKTE